MNKVIPFRKDYWEAMLLYKQGSIELLKNKDTIDIALEDKKRYSNLLKNYLVAA